MSQSYICLYYHLVFGTKHRTPSITDELRPRLWDYLGGIVRGEGGNPIQVGGMPDHVHLLVSLRQTIMLADFLRTLKAVSSGWINDTFPQLEPFRWQAGYGAFTVSYSGVERVRDYIRNQEVHHKDKSFEDEFRELLEKHEISFNEKYLWD